MSDRRRKIIKRLDSLLIFPNEIINLICDFDFHFEGKLRKSLNFDIDPLRNYNFEEYYKISETNICVVYSSTKYVNTLDIQVWNIKTGTLIIRIHEYSNSYLILKDNKILVISEYSEHGVYNIYDLTTGKIISKFNPKNNFHDKYFIYPKFELSNGKIILRLNKVGTGIYHIYIWDPEDPDNFIKLLNNNNFYFYIIDDNRYITLTDTDILIFDINPNNQIHQIANTFKIVNLNNLLRLENGNIIFIVEDGLILFNSKNYKFSRLLEEEDIGEILKISEEEIIYSQNSNIILFNIQTQIRKIYSIPIQESNINIIGILPDFQILFEVDDEDYREYHTDEDYYDEDKTYDIDNLYLTGKIKINSINLLSRSPKIETFIFNLYDYCNKYFIVDNTVFLFTKTILEIYE